MLELEASNQAAENTSSEREEFNRIMDAAVGPALEMSKRMAELKKDGTIWEKEIFIVNCVAYLQVCRCRFRAFYGHFLLFETVLNGVHSALTGYLPSIHFCSISSGGFRS